MIRVRLGGWIGWRSDEEKRRDEEQSSMAAAAAVHAPMIRTFAFQAWRGISRA